MSDSQPTSLDEIIDMLWSHGPTANVVFRAEAKAQFNRLLIQERITTLNRYIIEEANQYGDNGPEWAKGWNAYRQKLLGKKAKLQKKLSSLAEEAT